MKFEMVKGLDEEKFRRLTGVKRTTFDKMVDILDQDKTFVLPAPDNDSHGSHDFLGYFVKVHRIAVSEGDALSVSVFIPKTARNLRIVSSFSCNERFIHTIAL